MELSSRIQSRMSSAHQALVRRAALFTRCRRTKQDAGFCSVQPLTPHVLSALKQG